MNRRYFTFLSTLSLVTSLGIVGCSQGSSAILTTVPATSVNSAESHESVSLTIAAAASVQDAMKEIQTAYEAEVPNVVVTYNFGSSGSLAQQIRQGAPVDVFLSASEQWMDDLASSGELVDSSRVDLLQNAMVLIVPQDTTGIADFSDLGIEGMGKVAIAEPDSVPAGRYAKEVLTTFELFEPLRSQFVFGKDVRQVLSYVGTGNVDAGLVYATDALVSNRVNVVATAPKESHSAIVYPVAVVDGSTNVEAAQAFIDFLSGDTANTIFEEHGFIMGE